MTITLEELRKKYEELGAMIKSFEEQQEEAEFPKEGDIYYSIDAYGKIRKGGFADGITNTYHIPLGNCFRTKEEAEFAVEQLKVITELKRCGGVFETKRGLTTLYHMELYENKVRIDDWSGADVIPVFWFPTEEAAQKAIDTIGTERLLKYWFCVEVEG